MTKHATLARLALGLVLGAMLTGCGSRAADSKVLRVSLFGELETVNIMNKRFEAFTGATGIPLKPEFVPYGSYHERLLAQLAAGIAPDVIWMESDLFAPLYFGKAILPLDEWVKKEGLGLSAYYPQVLGRFSVGGKLYALPQDTAPEACLYYNRALFRRAGLAFPTQNWRWADLLAAAKKLTRHGKNGTEVWGFQDNYSPDWAGAILSNGGRLVDDEGHPSRCCIDEPAAVEAVRFLVSLTLEHKVSPPQGSGEAMASLGQDRFCQGKVAMVRTGLWITPVLRKVSGLDWDIAPFPRGPRAKVPGWSTGGSGWAISRDAKDPERAWALVRFLASEESQSALATTGYVQPALQDLARSEAFLKSAPPENKGFLLDAVRYAHYRPFHPRWDEAERAYIQPRLDQVWRGDLDAEEALRAAAKDVNENIFGKPGAQR